MTDIQGAIVRLPMYPGLGLYKFLRACEPSDYYRDASATRSLHHK